MKVIKTVFKQISSPHSHAPRKTSDLMLEVLIATIPGVIALTWFFGWGTLINIVLAISMAISMEAIIMKLRGRPIGFYIGDYSAIVTAVLFAIAIPQYLPWWATLIGILFAIVIAKHLYGGMGYNPFNPAMVGYVVLLISFPVDMVEWAAPVTQVEYLPGFIEALRLIFLEAQPIDGVTAATALDIVKQNDSLMLDQLYEQSPQLALANFASAGGEWVNIGFLIGGAFLVWRKMYTCHAPVGMLGSMLILSSLWYDGGSSSSTGSPLFHLFTGATMLGAFFIITDPVSGCTSNLGRLIFGIGVGSLTFIIRAWGNYPDAVAFGVLLMNFAAPLIDYYTQPRTYGHDKPSKARINKG